MDVLLPRCCPAKINKSGEFEVVSDAAGGLLGVMPLIA
jgi:hypothetical protein